MEKLKESNLNRVLISCYGEATTPSRASAFFNVTPDIIFRREDGWTLGAPEEWEHQAWRLYRDEWTHFARRTDSDWKGIEDYLM